MLEARSLTKYYDHRPVVRQVSFQIERGEITAADAINQLRSDDADDK